MQDITPKWEDVALKNKIILNEDDFGNRIGGLGSPTVSSVIKTQQEVETLGSQMDITGWTSTLQFSPFGYRVIVWSAGDIILRDGGVYNIFGGNTPDMTGTTYIYFDKNVSLTNLQTSTNATDSVGYNKILVAVAQPNSVSTSQASFQVFGGAGGFMVTKEGIAAGTITGDKIAANTINVNQLIAGTLTGFTIQTSATDTRVEINGASNSLYHYQSGVLRTAITNGQIAFFRPGDGTASGSITGASTSLDIDSGNMVRVNGSYIFGNFDFHPSSDNVYNLGTSSNSWSYLFSQNVALKGSGGGFVVLSAPYMGSGNIYLTLPSTTGNTGQILYNTGSGYLGWKDDAGGASLRGRVNSAGTLFFKSGMHSGDSALKMSTGVYRVFHTLGHTNYAVVATPKASLVKNISVSDIQSYFFEVRISNLSDTLEDNEFSFIIMT